MEGIFVRWKVDRLKSYPPLSQRQKRVNSNDSLASSYFSVKEPLMYLCKTLAIKV